jgi:undecaprenyl-diphosphatase
MIANVSTASFPSGHTALAFTIAVMLSDWRPDLKNYLYSLAVLIGFSRIYLGAHFLVDVLAGALLGYLIGRVVLSDKLDKLD